MLRLIISSEKHLVRTLAFILGILLYLPLPSQAQKKSIAINSQESGMIFNGIGAVSAGASSRLLYDYPEPERSQILDYLFKPNYGAALQILKVEIGGDMNSTDGAEASHMRKPSQVNCNRGFEWWLMKEAKKRNPNIKLAGLEWGTPGWLKKFWSDENIDYNIEWLKCAEKHDLKIDYMGGWNERGYNTDWYIKYAKALQKYDPHIKLIGSDECCRRDIWHIADDMSQNDAFNKAVDIVGVHFPCGHRSDYKKCESTETARRLDKPLWISENSALNHDVGAMPIARIINRMYIDAGITGYMSWSAVSAWYANLPIADTGLLLAEWPWSGYYQVGKSIWTYAHTSQFTKPGWHYIDNASGYLDSGASYVTLASPDGKDFSTIIEAMDALVGQNVSFTIQSHADSIYVWETNLRSHSSKDYFKKKETIDLKDGRFQINVEPGYLYTLSTVTGTKKGEAHPEASISKRMKLPYSEDFESYRPGELAHFFSDINGAFETAPCGAGRKGMCYRQVLTEEPINWVSGVIQPGTIIGDPQWWGNYTAGTDVLLEQSGYIELVSRVAAQQRATRFAGYHLRVSSNGQWELYRQDLKGQKEKDKHTISSGSVAFNVGEWHHMAMQMQDSSITILIDGKKVGSVQEGYFNTGQIALMVSPWEKAQFDNLEIIPVGSTPKFVPNNNMEITATSDHPENYAGYDFEAANAVDGRPETVWSSEWEPKTPLPQSVTIDLGGSYKLKGLVYEPRIDDKMNGMITEYDIYLSSDGVNFKKVKSGTWPTGTATKITTWTGEPEARYLRLQAVEGVGGTASAGEIKVMITK